MRHMAGGSRGQLAATRQRLWDWPGAGVHYEPPVFGRQLATEILVSVRRICGSGPDRLRYWLGEIGWPPSGRLQPLVDVPLPGRFAEAHGCRTPGAAVGVPGGVGRMGGCAVGPLRSAGRRPPAL